MRALLLSDKLRLFHAGLAFQGERASQSTSLTKPHGVLVRQRSWRQSPELAAMGDPHPALPTPAPPQRGRDGVCAAIRKC